ncbi:MAG: hypothetical protein EAZ92_01175 [Candidatus Kapaibacterium sp.]|nr:MAG: hypothetical protein EAZ92_01175 [Candidatus Kapabacteria bacterium]
MKNTLTSLQARYILGLMAVFYFLRFKATSTASQMYSTLQAFLLSRAVNAHEPLKYLRSTGNAHEYLNLRLSNEY